MKNALIFFIVLFNLQECLLIAQSQLYNLQITQNLNYIHTITPVQKMTSVPEPSVVRDGTAINEQVSYFDGLGRLVQKVDVHISPNGKDIVQPIVYDAFGREEKKIFALYRINGRWYI